MTTTGTDKTTGFQKGFAIVLLLAVAYGALKLYNTFSDVLIKAVENTWILIGVGAPLALLILYIVTNPLVVWGFFKTLSWKLTSWFIKLDPLSVMDRYADYLTKKLKNLNIIKTNLVASKAALGRKMETLKDSISENLKRGSAAVDQHQASIASLAGTKVQIDKQSLAAYQPIYDKMTKNIEFLDELSENWGTSIEKLRYTIDRKREEYTSLKETAQALNQASEFANGDTEASRLYNESVKQLEISVTQKIATIEEFEKNSKDILAGMKVDKQVSQDEGLSAIEEYRKNGSLLLPDFSQVASEAETIPFEVTGSKFHLSQAKQIKK